MPGESIAVIGASIGVIVATAALLTELPDNGGIPEVPRATLPTVGPFVTRVALTRDLSS